MAIAMTVRATKIQVLQEKVLSSLLQRKSSESKAEPKEEMPPEQGACSV
jgi:hypothetical protein